MSTIKPDIEIYKRPTGEWLLKINKGPYTGPAITIQPGMMPTLPEIEFYHGASATTEAIAAISGRVGPRRMLLHKP